MHMLARMARRSSGGYAAYLGGHHPGVYVVIDPAKLESIKRRMPPKDVQDIFKMIDLTVEDFKEWCDTVECLWKQNAELKAHVKAMQETTSGELEALRAMAKAADCFLESMGEEEEGNLRHHLAALKEKP